MTRKIQVEIAPFLEFTTFRIYNGFFLCYAVCLNCGNHFTDRFPGGNRLTEGVEGLIP